MTKVKTVILNEFDCANNQILQILLQKLQQVETLKDCHDQLRIKHEILLFKLYIHPFINTII